MPKPAKEKRPPCISTSLQKTGSLALQYMKFTLTSSFAYPTQYKNLQDSLKKQADWVWEKREGGRNRLLTSAQLHTNVYEVQKFAAELFFFFFPTGFQQSKLASNRLHSLGWSHPSTSTLGAITCPVLLCWKLNPEFCAFQANFTGWATSQPLNTLSTASL